jgi:hypothetical protein
MTTAFARSMLFGANVVSTLPPSPNVPSSEPSRLYLASAKSTGRTMGGKPDPAATIFPSA